MKTVLTYSGGLDSTVLLYQLLKERHTVGALSVNYGQRHSREIESARKICTPLGIEHRIADLRSITPLLAGNCLTTPTLNVPEGHYKEERMKETVVPNRNMILLSLATAWAISTRSDTVAYAAHSGDHSIYPDCRPEFATALDQAMQQADWHPVSLYRPFVKQSKADLVKRGHALEVPFEKTWSCYRGEAQHCGRCGTCLERREAFHLAGVPDPTSYAAGAPSLQEMIENNWKLAV